MAEGAVAMRRAHLGADHAMRAFLQLVHVGRHDRLGEAGPAAAGLELVGRGEQRLAGNDVDVEARQLVIVILPREGRSEEHTSELQSLMRISYAVFCLKKKKITQTKQELIN